MSLFDSIDVYKLNNEYLFESAKGKKNEDDEDIENVEPEAELADDDAADNDAEKIKDEEVHECVGCPAIEQAMEDNDFFALEAMAIATTLSNKAEACIESYSYATSYDEKVAIQESFSETAKKYWERFKAFLGRVRNMVVRTLQRFMGYVKRLIARISAKWATRNGAVEDIKKAVEAKSEAYNNLKVMVHEDLINKKLSELFKGKKFTADRSSDVLAFLDKAKTDAENNDLAEEIKKAVEDAVKGVDEYVKDLISEAKEVSVSKLDPMRIVEELKKIDNTYTSLNLIKDLLMVQIKKVEDLSKTLADENAKAISLWVQAIKGVVRGYNNKLSAINKIMVIWVQDRVSVLKAVKGVA